MRSRSLLFLTLFVAACLPSGPAAANGRPLAVMIEFTNRPGAAELRDVRRLGGEVQRSFHLIPSVAAVVPDTALAALGSLPGVVRVEPDLEVHALEYGDASTGSRDWGVVRIGADNAHAEVVGTGVKLAVVDSGIDCAHLEHVGASCSGYDFVNDDSDATDDNGHGTHVAGIAAAALQGTGSSAGVVGVAPGAQLVALKVLASDLTGPLSNVVAALEWSVDNGVQVVNMSLGRKSGTRQLKAAVENASAAGLVLVAAAGNGGMCNGKGDSVSYPAAYPEVIAVAATDSSDNRPCWSSTGPDVELAAPGVAVYSAWPHGIATSARDPQPVCEDQDGDGVDEACHFKYGSGTSMSSPHVAGAAALVFSAGAASNGAVRQLLQETATDLGTPGRDAQYGYGLVDAAAAVAAAAG